VQGSAEGGYDGFAIGLSKETFENDWVVKVSGFEL
jgi:hypothetical protein